MTANCAHIFSFYQEHSWVHSHVEPAQLAVSSAWPNRPADCFRRAAAVGCAPAVVTNICTHGVFVCPSLPAHQQVAAPVLAALFHAHAALLDCTQNCSNIVRGVYPYLRLMRHGHLFFFGGGVS